jgi:putative DNA primase/helicase
MHNRDLEQHLNELKARAHGRWTEILRASGVDESILSRRNQPCPMCGGTDRFQYTDRWGEGNYHCRGCGAGGGLKLLQGALGCDFKSALRHVEDCVGAVSRAPSQRPIEPSAQRMKKLAQRIWDEAEPITPGDPVDRYLSSRGLALDPYPPTLRCHPSLGYYTREPNAPKARKVAEYAAMLACVQGPEGSAITLHRTYLQDGGKAHLPDAKKLLSAGINGAAVRLFAADTELALAEGIETALSVHRASGKPVWSALSAGNLEKLWIPVSVRRVCIYADNDAGSSFAGQAAAYALARRLKREDGQGGLRHVEVFVPRQAGDDWADVWLRRFRCRLKSA